MIRRRDYTGAILGTLTFLCGISLIIFTFVKAYALFSEPPTKALDLHPEFKVNVDKTIETVVYLLYRIILLLLMSFAGSLIASKGIGLYLSTNRRDYPENEVD